MTSLSIGPAEGPKQDGFDSVLHCLNELYAITYIENQLGKLYEASTINHSCVVAMLAQAT